MATTPVTASPVSLKPGQTYTVSASNQSISGSSGQEQVLVPAGVWNTAVDALVDKVQLATGIFNTGCYRQNTNLVFTVPGQGVELILTPSLTGTQVLFADGSAATYKTTSTGISVHYDAINLPTNASLSLPNGDVKVKGGTGFESVYISQGLNNIYLDSSVEQVKFGQKLFALSMSSGKGFLDIMDASGGLVAELALSSGKSETLVFSNAIGTLGLGASGLGSFTLTDLLLDANQQYTVTQSNLKLYGNAGSEGVVLASGALNETVDSRVEKVTFSSGYAGYSLKTGSNDIKIFNAAQVLVADVFVANNLAGTLLQFSDAAITAKFINGALTLSNTSVSSSPTTGFQYAVTWGNFGTAQSGIQACLNKAMADLGKFINAKGVFDVQVLPESTSPSVLAEASGAMVQTGAKTEKTEFQLESLSGTDANGSTFDATVYVNLANISRFNLDPTKQPLAGQYDLTTVLEHELLHAIGFTGEIGTSSGVSSSFDQFVNFVNGQPFFMGASAQAVYGGPVPLAPASAGAGSAYYHLNLNNDLMSTSIAAGQIRSISKLDLAMLQDMGVPMLVGVATLA